AASAVVGSCVLIIVLLCVECIERHIHHSCPGGKRGERARKRRMQRWMQNGLDDSKRNEVRRTSGGHQSNVDSNRSLIVQRSLLRDAGKNEAAGAADAARGPTEGG